MHSPPMTPPMTPCISPMVSTSNIVNIESSKISDQATVGASKGRSKVANNNFYSSPLPTFVKSFLSGTSAAPSTSNGSKMKYSLDFARDDVKVKSGDSDHLKKSIVSTHIASIRYEPLKPLESTSDELWNAEAPSPSDVESGPDCGAEDDDIKIERSISQYKIQETSGNKFRVDKFWKNIRSGSGNK